MRSGRLVDVPANVLDVYLSKWPEKGDTRRTMRGALDRVARTLGAKSASELAWEGLRYDVVRAVAAKLSDAGLAVKTINRDLSALRGVLETAWRLGLIPNDEYRGIEVKNVRGSSLPAGRVLTSDEMDALYAALEKTTKRDAAILAVLAATGIRRVEASRLVKSDFIPKTRRLVATGKNNKQRSIPVAPRWCVYIEEWWEKIKAGQRIFAMEGDPRSAITRIVAAFHKEMGLKVFTPHDLRRTFGTYVEQQQGMAMAQRLLGHENIQTTSLYVRIDEAREEAAVRGL
jgi:integrase